MLKNILTGIYNLASHLYHYLVPTAQTDIDVERAIEIPQPPPEPEPDPEPEPVPEPKPQPDPESSLDLSKLTYAQRLKRINFNFDLIPDEFLCELSEEIMEFPCHLNNKHVDLNELEAWWQKTKKPYTDPFMGDIPVRAPILIDHGLKARIEKFVAEREQFAARVLPHINKIAKRNIESRQSEIKTLVVRNPVTVLTMAAKTKLMVQPVEMNIARAAHLTFCAIRLSRFSFFTQQIFGNSSNTPSSPTLSRRHVE